MEKLVAVAKAVKGYEGKYTIDEDGNIYNIHSGKFIKHRMIGDVRVVDLRNDEYHTTLSVNKLVYEHFEREEVEEDVKEAVSTYKSECLKDSLIRAYEFKIEVLETLLEEERIVNKKLKYVVEDVQAHLAALDLLVELATEEEA